MLTTFNELDMSAVMNIRAKYKEQFEKTHGVKLGFMSFFAKASAIAECRGKFRRLKSQLLVKSCLVA